MNRNIQLSLRKHKSLGSCVPRRKNRNRDQTQLCTALQSVRFMGVDSKKEKNSKRKEKDKTARKKSVFHYSNMEYARLGSVCVQWVLALCACFTRSRILARIMMTNLSHCCVINVAQLSPKISFQRFP